MFKTDQTKGDMMKLIAFVSICALSIALVQTGYNKDWPQFGHDSHRTFFSHSSVSESLEIQWSYLVAPREEGYRVKNLSSPAVVGDKAYIPSRNSLICLDLVTGEFLYEIPAYAWCPSTPTVVDGRVYLAAEENLFQCLEASTGDILWEREINDVHWINPLPDDSTLYVTAQNFYVHSPMEVDIAYCWKVPQWSTLLALDKETGHEMWQYSAKDDSVFAAGAMGFPILVNGTLLFYVYSYEDEESYHAKHGKSYLVCIDAYTGTLTWKRDSILPSSPTESGSTYPYWLAYHENRMYVSLKGSILSIDMEKYQRLWEYKLIKGEYALLSVSNRVMARGTDWVYCLDAETGQELWKIPVEGALTTPAQTRDYAFIGSSDGNLYQIHIKSGEFHQYYLGGEVFSPVVANGYVLVGASDNRIYCLGHPPSFNPVVLTAVVAIVLLIGLLVLKRTRRS